MDPSDLVIDRRIAQQIVAAAERRARDARRRDTIDAAGEAFLLDSLAEKARAWVRFFSGRPAARSATLDPAVFTTEQLALIREEIDLAQRWRAESRIDSPEKRAAWRRQFAAERAAIEPFLNR